MKDNVLAAIGVAVVFFVFPYYILSLERPANKAPAAAKPAAPSSSSKVGKVRRGRGVNCECQWNDQSK